MDNEKQERDFLINGAKDDLLYFMSLCDPVNYTMSDLHWFIAKHLQDVFDGKTKRLVISTPPQVGKTELCSIGFPCWALGKKPRLKFGLISYNQTHANKKSKFARAKMQSEAYQEIFDTRISKNDASVESWSTSGGGSYSAIGVGGGTTGNSYDIIAIDDPIKNWEEATSDNRQELVWEWFWSSVYTRCQPHTAIILLMTRWSSKDLAGRLTDPEWQKAAIEAGFTKEEEKWKVINLPALAHENDPLGRKPGASVFPEKYTKEFYEGVKRDSLPFMWSALYDGSPVVQGGNYIPVGNFEYVDEAPEGLRWVRGWDLATEAKETADETAGIAAAIGPNGELYFRDLVHNRMNWPEARDTIAKLAVAERYIIGVEAVAGFKTAFQNLVEVMPPYVSCVEVGVHKDKLTRALPWINMVAKRKVFLVGRNPKWHKDFILQCQSFTGNGKEDDDMCLVSGTKVSTPEGLKNIQTIKYGDLVFTRHGIDVVEWAGKTGMASEIYTVELEGGLTISGTGSHRVLLENGDWIRLDSVHVFCRIQTCKLNQSNVRLVEGSRLSLTELPLGGIQTQKKMHTKDISSHRVNTSDRALIHFIGRFGGFITEQFRKATKYTTKTSTTAITELKTWSALIFTLTNKNTMEESLQKRQGGILNLFGICLANGTDRQKESSGTKSMLKLLDLAFLSQKVKNVLSVAKLFKIKHLTGVLNAARLTVIKNGMCVRKKTKKPEFALNANSRSQLTDSAGTSVALKVVRLQKEILKNQVPVFNLKVKNNHEYIANGIVAHNCDAATVAFELLGSAFTAPIPMSTPDRYSQAMAARRVRSVTG